MITNNGNWGMNPRKAKGGIKARTVRGQFVTTWWGQRWIQAMERLVTAPRLARGQYYARLGQVTKMEETRGGVVAYVQGSRPKPYKVTIQVTPFTRAQWQKVLDVLANQAIFTAQLLAGEMPDDIEQAFAAAGVSLFPDRSSELITKCTCPDKANPCKHIAAAHYILGERFDEDPFLLFRLRGQTQEQLLEALRRRRGGHIPRRQQRRKQEKPADVDQPFQPEEIRRFWQMGAPLDDFTVQIRTPTVPQPLLRRLGEPELPGPLCLHAQLEEAYDAITQATLLIAFGDAAAELEEVEEE